MILPAAVLALMLPAFAFAAGTLDDMKTTLITDKEIYQVGDPISVTIVISNEGPSDIITTDSFTVRPFHLDLLFTDPHDPAGKPITAKSHWYQGDLEPPPPATKVINGRTRQVDKVFTLGSDWVITVDLADAHDFYELDKTRWYALKAVIPMRTYWRVDRTYPDGDYTLLRRVSSEGSLVSNTVYFAIVGDSDGDNYSIPEALSPPFEPVPDCDDNDSSVNPGATEIPNNIKDDDCDPGTPDLVPEPPGTVSVKTYIKSDDESEWTPLPDVDLRLYDNSHGSCAAGIGTGPLKNEIVWKSCTCTEDMRSVSDASGNASIQATAGKYYVLGKYDAPTGDPLYDSKVIGNLPSGGVVLKKLKFKE
jgi:hypothetical protein